MIYNLLRMQQRATWPNDLDTALKFSSPEAFSISTTKNWDGKLEYTNGSGWETWDGKTITSGENENSHYIYIRGTGNSKITGTTSSDAKWSITGTNIACNGDIDLLLDYATVKSGNHPVMVDNCYYAIFSDCTNLTAAPSLPATTLAKYCYGSMFSGCTSLATAPSLPATTLAPYCYSSMFFSCTSLTTAPSLPATTLANSCYSNMFYNCTSLKTAPSLPATTLANYCYGSMFYNCTSLKTAPSLPATTLEPQCYSQMFKNCVILLKASSLPATTLASSCYSQMFYGCQNLKTVPSLPATALASSCYNSMFQGCTKIKLSTTASGTYTKPYRIPESGTGTTASSALSSMFYKTGGTFKSTPTINTTYYLDTSNTIV